MFAISNHCTPKHDFAYVTNSYNYKNEIIRLKRKRGFQLSVVKPKPKCLITFDTKLKTALSAGSVLTIVVINIPSLIALLSLLGFHGC